MNRQNFLSFDNSDVHLIFCVLTMGIGIIYFESIYLGACITPCFTDNLSCCRILAQAQKGSGIVFAVVTRKQVFLGENKYCAVHD